MEPPGDQFIKHTAQSNVARQNHTGGQDPVSWGQLHRPACGQPGQAEPLTPSQAARHTGTRAHTHTHTHTQLHTRVRTHRGTPQGTGPPHSGWPTPLAPLIQTGCEDTLPCLGGPVLRTKGSYSWEDMSGRVLQPERSQSMCQTLLFNMSDCVLQKRKKKVPFLVMPASLLQFSIPEVHTN